MKNEDLNNKIVLKIWSFMNESPILSAIIISIIAILGSQLVKLYTYIYWLPYFNFFNIPLHYFDIAIFDKYALISDVILISFIVMIFFTILQYIEKKYGIIYKFGLLKSFMLAIFIICGCIILKSILVLKTSVPNFLKLNIWNYIIGATLLLVLKHLFPLIISKVKFKRSISSIILGVLFIIVSAGSIIYIHGYNVNVVANLSGQLKIIDENKMVLFETSDKYYIISYKKVQNNSIKIYRDSYAFIDKNEQLVQRNYYNLYDEYGIKLDY